MGIFPDTYPRDPVDVNVFLEHILLGQILEPLVEARMDGSIVGAAADRWEVSADQREIHFFVREGLRFSNGAPVRADDVVFSLRRHVEAKSSQSKAYLSRIKELLSLNPREVRLVLDAPYAAIFKALSREQLGILPAGWRFDSAAAEPFIGTGPYRAIRRGDEWSLLPNPHFRAVPKNFIPEWKLVLERESHRNAPDLVPFGLAETIDALEQSIPAEGEPYRKEEVVHFFQSSAWWYPRGRSFEDLDRKRLGMQIVRDLISARVSQLGLKRATGVIPEGILGYLPEPWPVPGGLPSTKAGEKFKVAALRRDMRVLNDSSTVRELETKYGVEIELESFEPAEFASLPQRQPDILLFAYGGGFHDPEGFLTVITAMLQGSLESVFGEAYPLYLAASSETEPASRDRKYQALNGKLQELNCLVPGWRLQALRAMRGLLQAPARDLRYLPRLMDFSRTLTEG